MRPALGPGWVTGVGDRGLRARRSELGMREEVSTSSQVSGRSLPPDGVSSGKSQRSCFVRDQAPLVSGCSFPGNLARIT